MSTKTRTLINERPLFWFIFKQVFESIGGVLVCLFYQMQIFVRGSYIRVISPLLALKIHPEKAESLFQPIGVQYAKEETTINFDYSIAYSTANVKHFAIFFLHATSLPFLILNIVSCASII